MPIPSYKIELTILVPSPALSARGASSSRETAWRIDPMAKRHSSQWRYEPDSVVETKSRSVIFEVKARNELEHGIVKAKAAAASHWCKTAMPTPKRPSLNRGSRPVCPTAGSPRGFRR